MHFVLITVFEMYSGYLEISEKKSKYQSVQKVTPLSHHVLVL